MGKWKRRFGALMQKTIDAVLGSSLSQQEVSADGSRAASPAAGALLRRAAAEGCVLLKNDGTLPLAPERSVAVFGRCQLDWFYVGYGSGGGVNAPYYVNLIEGLDRAGAAYDKELAEAYRSWCAREENRAKRGRWGHWPFSHPEMPVGEALLRAAASRSDTALVVLGRAAGEDRDSRCEPGSYRLTQEEKALLEQVTTAFAHTVVLVNSGGVIELSQLEQYPLSALLLVWQGGMESGSAACDVLYGAVDPCGRLADTVARSCGDYPSSDSFGGEEQTEYAEGIFVGYRHFDAYALEQVLYPFGFGLSYTTFRTQALSFARDGGVSVRVRVANTGGRAGREVVLLWCRPPKEGLKKPVRVLAAFAKTDVLAPGESQELTLACDAKTLASFDEARHAFVLEPGEYLFEANGAEAGAFTLTQTEVLERCEPIVLAPEELRRRILERLPEELPPARGGGAVFDDVARGSVTPEEFIAQLPPGELEALTRGHGRVSSPLGVPGNAGVFGGVTDELRRRGVPPVSCCDGPAGVRARSRCSLLPCGTALACTFDTALVEQVYALAGEELRRCGGDVLLAPGMNLHRHPLCGRNFEYFSEDPLLSGKMGAAAVRGAQSAGVAACPKHFACNNQETKRNVNDSRVGERALRELYLRGFEICVREGRPLALMTSYNKINGVWAHYHYDLVTTVLRGEWGFDGMVMTDWWMQRAKSPEFPALRDNAYRVRAQVDLLMPGSMSHGERRCRPDRALLRALGQPDGLRLGELQRCARNILTLCLRLRGQEAKHIDTARRDGYNGEDIRQKEQGQ